MSTGVFRRRWQQPPRRAVSASKAAQVDRTVSTTPATWQWAAVAATVERGREVSTTPATWVWTANAAGIPRNVSTTPATWVWNALAAEINPSDTPPPPPGGGKGAGCRYPRRVMIDGVVYWVCSAEEERELLRQYYARLEREALELALSEAPPEKIKKARMRVVRAAKRVEKVDDREAEWLARLRREDEEILLAFNATLH